jgi:NAD(P)-dependent dehydrogenase (short-subunit alcohol dehydrogenase family)
MSASIKGRRIIVTGAAGGIGSGAVRGLAAGGARIAAVYHRTEPTADLKPLGRWYQCDLGHEGDIKNTFAKIADDFGGIDALVNVAGRWQPTPVGTVEGAQIDQIMADNFKSVVFTNQEAYGLMKDKGGRIVNFGSVEGVEGNSNSPIYASSKAAVHAWTRSAARSWGRYGITVNAVAPAIDSQVYRNIRDGLSDEQRVQLKHLLVERIPLGGNMGDAERDCAPVLAFLVSDDSHFITGQLIPIDGGLLMMRG